MHPNLAFRRTSAERNIEFVRHRCFGALCVNAAGGPLVSHIPFQLSDDGSFVEAHLVRSNPILAKLSEPCEAVIAVSGGDGYVSPDWYGIDDQVPTWNYIAVHIRGILKRLPQSELTGILDRISGDMEARLLPKKPWTAAKMTPEIYEKMQRQIVPVRMEVGEITGTWKLSQNKTDAVRLAAADEVDGSKTGLETSALAKLMVDLPK